jgi:hypothetical protein
MIRRKHQLGNRSMLQGRCFRLPLKIETSGNRSIELMDSIIEAWTFFCAYLKIDVYNIYAISVIQFYFKTYLSRRPQKLLSFGI